MDRYYLMKWDQFQFIVAMPEQMIFIEETEEAWIMETYVGHALVRCEKLKTTPEENIIFVERYLTNNEFVRKVEIQENNIEFDVKIK